jgi:hypothetical protein
LGSQLVDYPTVDRDLTRRDGFEARDHPKESRLAAPRRPNDCAPALETRKKLLKQLDRMNVAIAILPVEATKNGALQSREDARRSAAFFLEQRDTIDCLVICLPNFGDELHRRSPGNLGARRTWEACSARRTASGPSRARSSRDR